MPRLRRYPKLDVLFGREPSELGKGCALQKSRLTGRSTLGSTEREHGSADFCKKGGSGAHDPAPVPVGFRRQEHCAPNRPKRHSSTGEFVSVSIFESHYRVPATRDYLFTKEG